jgi:hypothetical protein
MSRLQSGRLPARAGVRCRASLLDSLLRVAAAPRRAALKAHLLEAASSTALGARATPAVRQAVDKTAAALEQLQSDAPVFAQAAGLWVLVYTTEQDVHAFARLPGGFQVSASQQLAWTEDGGVVTNTVDLRPVLRLTAVAPATLVPPRRVEYRFSLLRVALFSDALCFEVPLARLGMQPGGWSDTTFVDEDTRIARNSRGDLLLLRRDTAS